MEGRNNKIHIAVTFIILTALTLAVCITAFTLLAGNGSIGRSLAFNFLVSFPLCFGLSIVDYMLINRLHRAWKRDSYFIIIIDWLLASVIGAAASVAVRLVMGMTEDLTEGIFTFLVWNSMIVMGIELFLYHKSIMEKETLLAVAEKEKAAYQFEALKSQINPHFLFNSLNALASLAYHDAERANLFAKKLSSVYRYLLSTYSRRLVSLDEELDFLDSYMYLEKIRFGDAVRITLEVEQEERRKMIVPASLQLLVENALKHNTSTSERPLNIIITAKNGLIRVENNLQTRNEVSSSGIGLANLRKQYGINGRSINVIKTENAFIVELPLICG